MTPIQDRFYFRLATERYVPLETCEVFYRRENKRWWQREYVFVTRSVYWGEDEDGTPEEYALKILKRHQDKVERSRAREARLAEYKDLKRVPS